MAALPILIPATTLAFAVIAAVVSFRRAALATVTALVGAVLSLVLAGIGLSAALRVGALRHQLGGWPPPVGIEYILDPLSGYMAVIIGIIGVLVLIYPMRAGFGSMPSRRVPVASLTLLLLTGLLGVVFSGDLFNLFVFLEVYAIASYALISFGGDRALFASFRYLIIGTAGSGFYLLGVGFLYFSTGALNMEHVAGLLPALTGSPTVTGALVLIVVGLGIKAALFPLHVWLPDAHSYAPPAVAALLAAVQVKVAAYALIRIFHTVFAPGEVAVGLDALTLLAWFGAAGIVAGSVAAILQHDLKRLLAYSTVAQLGYIAVGIGLATPLGLIAALLHVLNHAFMKSCLFLVAGGIIVQTGLRDISRFTGLGRRLPWTMAAFALAAVSMVGVPPTAGFFSKWYLLLATIEAGQWLFAVVIVGSTLLTLAYFLRIFERVFIGEPEEEAVAGAVEPGGQVLGPVWVLAAGVVVFGLANVAIVVGVLEPAVARLMPGS
jgi:multicomponent Na+:H+ antiporter subunit D